MGSAKISLIGRLTRSRRKNADETIDLDDTLSNDPDIVVPLKANTNYKFELLLITDAGAATPNIQIDWVVPAGASGGGSVIWGDITNNAYVAFATPIGITTNTLDGIYKYTGNVNVGVTSGTLQLRWAQSTLDAATTTVKAGTCLIIEELSTNP